MSASRPSPMKRQSSQSSYTSKHTALSPASLGEHHNVRHHVKPGRKTKIVLPRTHGSGRNLVKLAQQSQNPHPTDEPRRGSKQKSRESDSEIRLPGSLDDHRAPPLRRNFTATHLPRNTSHTKLKKNLSHGQLTKLGVLPNAGRGPPSPGLKGRSKRPKSADMAELEMDLHEQEVELAYQQQQGRHDGPKKVGFAVGSSDGGSEVEDLPQMDGQGLQEDEWTDQSASASPYSTRQNTANNSRRASVAGEKPLDRRAILNSKEYASRHVQQEQHETSANAKDNTAETSESAEEGSHSGHEQSPPTSSPSAAQAAGSNTSDPIGKMRPNVQSQRRQASRPTKEHANPATRRILSRSSQSPAPALVSNVSAVDNVRTTRTSPSASMASSRSNIQTEAPENVEQEEELVSRFMPTGSAATATPISPQTDSLRTPESESMLTDRRTGMSATGFSIGPVSPESARSLSTGGHVPTFLRFRNEEKMMNEKALAELEDAAANFPIIPPHVFDRRNESLKSYLNLATLGTDGRGSLAAANGLSIGPEIFEGRFKAVNAELKVVQRFRDPIGESMARLHLCKECNFAELRAAKASSSPKQDKQIHVSKSTTSLPRHSTKGTTSASPPKPASVVKPHITSAKSASQIKRGKVAFSQVSPSQPESLVSTHGSDGRDADAIARSLWDGTGG